MLNYIEIYTLPIRNMQIVFQTERRFDLFPGPWSTDASQTTRWCVLNSSENHGFGKDVLFRWSIGLLFDVWSLPCLDCCWNLTVQEVLFLRCHTSKFKPWNVSVFVSTLFPDEPGKLAIQIRLKGYGTTSLKRVSFPLFSRSETLSSLGAASGVVPGFFHRQLAGVFLL